MRSLYLEPQTYEQLISETELELLRLNTILSRLLAYGDIKKRKIATEEPVKMLDEKRIQADILDIPVKTKTKYHNEYELTKKGHDKLVYFELKYRFFERWCPYSEEGWWHDSYIQEIDKYYRKNTHKFGS